MEAERLISNAVWMLENLIEPSFDSFVFPTQTQA